MGHFAPASAFDYRMGDHPRQIFLARVTSGPMAAVWSTLISISIALGFVAANPALLHWFLLPVTLCGCLIGIDMVNWISHRLDLYDATGLTALLGYHFFFVAPLLMMTWQYRMKYLNDQPADYREWLGAMACLNLAGLLLYKCVLKATLALRAKSRRALLTSWQVDNRRFWALWLLFLILSGSAQLYIFIAFGGVSGYIASYSQYLSGRDMFQGWALVFAVGESFPVLLTMGLAVYWRKRTTSSWTIVFSLLALTGLILLSGGLRGSRSNVIWGLFWVLGIVHFYVHRLPRILGPIALCLLYAFVSIYAAYKQHGSDLLHQVATSGDYSSVSGNTEGPATVLVGDFSRCDVQAYLLYKLVQTNAVHYAYGASYLGAITMLVPRSLWPGRPPTILKWTTEAEYGEGSYQVTAMQSSRVYGIAGEAMLNFGPAGALLAYIWLGFLTALLESTLLRLSPGDSRWLIAPFLINLLFLLLLNDSDNAVFYLVKYGLMPISLVVLSSTRRQVRRIAYGSAL